MVWKNLVYHTLLLVSSNDGKTWCNYHIQKKNYKPRLQGKSYDSEGISMKLWESIRYSIFNSYWWSDFWYKQVLSRLRPRSKWLTKQIPRTWVDKDIILEICVLGSLKHYVEIDGEDCFNVLSTTNPPDQAEFMSKVRRHYELATQNLVALQKELDAAWEAVPHRTLEDLNKTTKEDHDRTYGKIYRLEKELYDLQTDIMVWIVKNRNGLWT